MLAVATRPEVHIAAGSSDLAILLYDHPSMGQNSQIRAVFASRKAVDDGSQGLG